MAKITVRLESELVEDARRYGQLFNRSTAGQIEHWAKLGRAIEASPDFGIRQIADLLATLERGLFPEHPHRPVARMEAAVEVVGMRIAELSSALYLERRSATRDDARIESLLEEITHLRGVQEELSPEKTELVNAILSGKIPPRADSET